MNTSISRAVVSGGSFVFWIYLYIIYYVLIRLMILCTAHMKQSVANKWL